MKRLLFFLLLLAACSAFADDFGSFMQQQNSGFSASKNEWNTYKSSVSKDFDTYKDIMNQEFASYKSAIAKKWNNVKVSEPHSWVEYLNDYRIRKTVDFDSKTIKIEILSGNGKPDFAPVLRDLINEDTSTAFNRNPVSANTEAKIKTAVPGAETKAVPANPIVQNLYSSGKMTDDQVNALVGKLEATGNVTAEDTGKTGETVYAMTVKLPDDIYKKGAEDVQPFVRAYAQKYNLNPALVMAIIYTESRFNPVAVSYVPAYGLMQIVPSSAGMDATAFIEGQPRVLAPSYLYDPENNVKIGSAYFFLLYGKYFKGVTDPQSRLYCCIAAYNTGPGNVAYTFNQNNPAATSVYDVNSALPAINAMTSQQVYDFLRTNLKYNEARQYIVRVSGKIKDYSE